MAKKLTTRELQDAVENYQNGVSDSEMVDIPPVATQQAQAAPVQTANPQMVDIPQSDTYKELMFSPIGGGVSETDTPEALRAGYGLSRYDTSYYPGMDLEQNRALEQSAFNKVASGLLKGGITAATTAVNTVAGTVIGLGKGLFELGSNIYDYYSNPENEYIEDGQVSASSMADAIGSSIGGAVDAGVNNWLSTRLMNIQSWSEEAFPNYRTERERSEEYQKHWYYPSHIFRSNFIGDSILKNFGFTVGAMGGGYIWSRALGSLMRAKVANDIMKGAAVAAEGDAEATAQLKSIADRIRNGVAVGVDADALENNILNVARRINKMEAQLQLYGATIGAMGEGTVEGIMAKQEFLEDYNARLQEAYAKEYNSLEEEMLASGNPYLVKNIEMQMPDGTIANMPVLTNQGREQLLFNQKEVTDKYQNLQKYAEAQGDRLASTTFLLNLPILTYSNMFQFGRMFSGGWKTARKTLSGLNGGVAAKTGATVTAKEAALYKIPEIQGAYSATGSVAGKTILNTLKMAGAESFEEMAQGTVSSGAKRVAENNLSSYNDSGYDSESIHTFGRWFRDMYSGGKEYLTDIANWQEGFLGAITGVFGIPGRRWNGGVAEARRRAREEVDAARVAADKLNSLVNSKEFQDRWHAYIRHMKYDNQMGEALADDNQYAWHTADQNQLISDVMAFADAGRLEDLNQIVSAYGNMSESEAASLKKVLTNNGDSNTDWIKNASEKEIVDKVKSRANEIKDTITRYKDIYDALSARAPMDASPEYLKELVFTAMQIKSFDDRFLKMFEETMEEINPLLELMTATDEQGNLTSKEDAAKKFETVKNSIRFYLAGSLLPVNLPKKYRDSINQALDIMENIMANDPNGLGEKIRDMRKIASDRQDFYKKLQTLQSEDGPRKFEAEAVTPEKVEQAAEEAKARIDTSGLNTMNDVKRAYLEKNANGRADFLETISAIEDSNPAVKSFMNLKRRLDEFKAFINKNGYNSDDITLGPDMVKNTINSLLHLSKSEEELINLPDNVFLSFDEFAKKYTGIFGAPSESTYVSMKKAIRDAMKAYLDSESGSVARATVDPNFKEQQPEQGTVANTDGYDSAQPGSLEPAPQPVNTPAENAAPESPASPAPAPQTQDDVPVDSPTEDTLVNDTAVAMQDDTPENAENDIVSQKGQKNKTAYYRTSIPEIDSREAAKAREAIKNINSETKNVLKNLDLSNFGDKNPDFSELWNALNEAGAFDTVATELEVGDEIEFIVDPKFPTYKGQYQILMATNKGEERKILTILSGKTSQYYGLQDLRIAIDKEYRSFIEKNPNDIFVFSKKSKVWAKRSGVIDYDYSGKEEKGIKQIQGYSSEAPVVFIDRNGEARVINGKNKDSVNKVSDSFNSRETNLRDGKQGNLYYLVRSGDSDEKYIPIRLNVEHFKKENKDADNPVFQKIRDILYEMADIVRKSTADNIVQQNEKLHKKVSELRKYLDLHQDFFEIRNLENVGVAFRYSTSSDSENEGTLRTPSQMTDEWMENFVADLGRSLQIHLDANGKLAGFDDYVTNDLITSNARMMRPKGVDFYINPWVEERREFAPVTQTQAAVEKDLERASEESAPAPSSPQTVNDVVDENFDFGDRDVFGAFGEEPEPAFGETQILQEETVSNPEQDTSGVVKTNDAVKETLEGSDTDNSNAENVAKKFSELSEYIQASIKEKGYSEESYDKLPDKIKEKILDCL